MPLFLGALIGALIQAAGTLVGKVLISLGIGYATFTGVDASITWARDYALSSVAGVGGTTLQVLSTLKIGTCISILSSAFTARLLLNGLTGGTIKKMVLK